MTTGHSACNVTLYSLTPSHFAGPRRQELVDLPGVVLNVDFQSRSSQVDEVQHELARRSCGGTLAMRVQLRIHAVIIQQCRARLRGALAGEQYDPGGGRLWSDADQDRLTRRSCTTSFSARTAGGPPTRSTRMSAWPDVSSRVRKSTLLVVVADRTLAQRRGIPSETAHIFLFV